MQIARLGRLSLIFRQMEERRRQSCPGTLALACSTCGRLLTPCLLCAHPFNSCSPSATWHDCGKCGLRNLIGQRERHFLGFPSPFALSNLTARRVLVTHMGQRACMLGIYAELLHYEQDVDASEPISNRGYDTTNPSQESTKRSIFENSCKQLRLPFKLYEGFLIFSSSDTHSMSNNEAKELDDTCMLGGCASAPMEEFDQHTALRSSTFQGPSLTNSFQGHEATINMLKHGKINRCSECDGDCDASCKLLLHPNENQVLRCNEQLLALRCPKASKEDSPSSYPICVLRRRMKSEMRGLKTCFGQDSYDCGCQQVNRLSLGVLRMAHTFLTPYLEAWAASKKSNFVPRLEDVLAKAELFLEKRAALVLLQDSVSKMKKAYNVAIHDYQVLSQHQLSNSAGYLKNRLRERLREREEEQRMALEPFMGAKDEINIFLEFCYSQAHILSSEEEPLLCNAGEWEANIHSEKKNILCDALCQASLSWISLYHDFAHALGVL